MKRTRNGFVDQHEGDARTHYSWLPTRAYREAFGLLTYRDALPAFQVWAISPDLHGSPRVATDLPASPRISPDLPGSPRISPDLPPAFPQPSTAFRSPLPPPPSRSLAAPPATALSPSRPPTPVACGSPPT